MCCMDDLFQKYLSNESRQIHISVMPREKSVLQLGRIFPIPPDCKDCGRLVHAESAVVYLFRLVLFMTPIYVWLSRIGRDTCVS